MCFVRAPLLVYTLIRYTFLSSLSPPLAGGSSGYVLSSLPRATCTGRSVIFSLVAIDPGMHSDKQVRTKDGRFAAAGSDGVWAVEEKSSAATERHLGLQRQHRLCTGHIGRMRSTRFSSS